MFDYIFYSSQALIFFKVHIVEWGLIIEKHGVLTEVTRIISYDSILKKVSL